MCGNSGIFHGKLFHDPRIGHYDPYHGTNPVPDPQIVADQQASIAAEDAAAAWRLRRIRSSLQAGSIGVIGSPSVLGAAAGGGGASPGGRPGFPPRGGSVMGAGR
jgi:hypothetical protein